MLLSKLKKTRINYHNENNYIILKRGDKKVVQAKQSECFLC